MLFITREYLENRIKELEEKLSLNFNPKATLAVIEELKKLLEKDSKERGY